MWVISQNKKSEFTIELCGKNGFLFPKKFKKYELKALVDGINGAFECKSKYMHSLKFPPK